LLIFERKKMEYIDIYKLASFEVRVAVNWWAQFLKDIPQNNIIVFCEKLTSLIFARIYRSWNIKDPAKGSGYRSIINDYHMDPLLKTACALSKVNPDKLPRGIVMLINPKAVKIQLLENEKDAEIIYAGYYNF